MKRLLMVTVACWSMAATVAGSAQAGAGPFVFQFHDCVGPAGTPTSFTAEKTELPPAAGGFSTATAYRLTHERGVFVALTRDDLHVPPGIAASGAATVACLVDTPLLGTVRFTGFLTPSG